MPAVTIKQIETMKEEKPKPTFSELNFAQAELEKLTAYLTKRSKETENQDAKIALLGAALHVETRRGELIDMMP